MTAHTFDDFARFITPPVSLNGTLTWEPDFIIDKLLIKDGLNILGGADKAGKSLLRSYLTVCAVTGCPAFDKFKIQYQPKNVLLLAGEECELAEIARFRRVAHALGYEHGDLPIRILPPCGFMLDKQDWVQAFSDWLGENEIDLVVIDPLVRFHSRDENVQGQISPVLNRIRMIANTRATVWMAHHTHQPSDNDHKMSFGQLLRGSTDFGAIYDHLLIIKKMPGRNKKLRQIVVGPRYEEEIDPLQVEIESGETKNSPYKFTMRLTTKEVVPNILGKHAYKSANSVVKEANRKRSDVLKALEELVNEEVIEQSDEGYRLKND